MFRQAGVGNAPTVFLFDETQIVVETFLEDINNILTSGEVPNLFSKDELAGICEDVRPAAKQAGAGETCRTTSRLLPRPRHQQPAHRAVHVSDRRRVQESGAGCSPAS